MTRKVLILLCIALAIAGVVSWFASASPDGLERIAIDQKFEDAAGASSFEILPDYTIPGFQGFWSNALAGIVGTVVVFGVVMLVGKAVRVKTHRE
jgi:cobalt/nickel transport protein